MVVMLICCDSGTLVPVYYDGPRTGTFFLHYVLTDSSVRYIFSHMKGSNVAAHKGTKEMKKGQIVKCVGSHDSVNITVGKEYVITSGRGDERNTFSGFTDPIDDDIRAVITDDDDDSITIVVPECAFGKWEVMS